METKCQRCGKDVPDEEFPIYGLTHIVIQASGAMDISTCVICGDCSFSFLLWCDSSDGKTR